MEIQGCAGTKRDIRRIVQEIQQVSRQYRTDCERGQDYRREFCHCPTVAQHPRGEQEDKGGERKGIVQRQPTQEVPQRCTKREQ